MSVYLTTYVIVQCEYPNCLNTVQVNNTSDLSQARHEARSFSGYERVGDQDICGDHVNAAKRKLEKASTNGR